MLLLGAVLLFVIALVGEVDVGTESVTEPVDAGSTRTDDATNILTVNLELGDLRTDSVCAGVEFKDEHARSC